MLECTFFANFLSPKKYVSYFSASPKFTNTGKVCGSSEVQFIKSYLKLGNNYIYKAEKKKKS